jgi:hypothetical protein
METVYSTGRGRESVARDLIKKVEHCRHLSLADQAAISGAERYLDRAELLVTAAEGLLVKAAAEYRLTEVLAQAEELLEAANEHVAEFEALVDTAKTYEDEVRAVALEVRATLQSLQADSAATPTSLLDEAEEATRSATEQVKAVARAASCEDLKRRIATVRRQIQSVRSNPIPDGGPTL